MCFEFLVCSSLFVHWYTIDVRNKKKNSNEQRQNEWNEPEP